MELFTYMEKYDYEQVVVCHDKASGLKAIIAIHNTVLGPALGGTRMWAYPTEEEALEDALRLARGMTYKNAAAGLNFGGGKAVIIGDPRKDKSEALLRAFGRYVQSLNGRYITAADVGTTVHDMDTIHEETDYVTGVSAVFGSSGNPAPVTAYGIYLGIKAASKEAYGTDDLSGKTIAVQGVGNVAYELCKHLHEEEASLIVTDINKTAVQRVVHEFGAKAVDVTDIYSVPCDIFSPCALGGIINDETIPQLQAKVIAGSANNQLKEERHGDLLYKKGVVYAPDYVINAGGVINIADELHGYNRERALQKVEGIYGSLTEVFEISREKRISTSQAANELAERRIEQLSSSSRHYMRNNYDRFSSFNR